MAMEAVEIERLIREGIPDAEVVIEDLRGDGDHYAARVTSPVAYLRLHGRNAADWFREGAGRDARYDYLYSHEELGGLSSSAARNRPRRSPSRRSS